MTRIMTAAALALALGWSVAPPAKAEETKLENDMIVFEYNAPRNPKFKPIYERLKERKMLEQLYQFLSPLQLDGGLLLSLEEGGPICRGPNSYYDGQGTLHLCYSWFYFLENEVAKEYPREPNEPFTTNSLGLIPGFTRPEVLIGGTIGVTLHELGHGLFHINEIPLFGREEDAADQLAGLLMLQFGEEVALTTIKGFYNTWHHFNAERARQTKGQIPAKLEADSHSLDLQRAYNLLCMAYGKHPAAFEQLADQLLPRARKDGCAEEYKQAANAFNKTVLPFIDPKKMELVLKMQILRPEDFKL